MLNAIIVYIEHTLLTLSSSFHILSQLYAQHRVVRNDNYIFMSLIKGNRFFLIPEKRFIPFTKIIANITVMNIIHFRSQT